MSKSHNGNLLLKAVFILVYVVLGITIIIPFLASVAIYEVIFGARVEKLLKRRNLSDYPELKAERMDFRSGKNMLAGAVYTSKVNDERKALVVLCHGIGCGREAYLNRIDYFARKGYVVYAFDMTGSCDSGGKNIRGLVQSQLDLDSALKFLASREEFKDLEVLVYGHSWSGYAAACVPNFDGHDDIAGVASLSGFNNTWDSIRLHAGKYVGNLMALAKPYIAVYECIKFGRAAGNTAIDGINKAKCPILVEHSLDDPTVPYSLSVYSHKDECTNPLAEFVLFKDRGHTISRPVAAENAIKKSFADNPPPTLVRGKSSIFQFKVDYHYVWATLDDIFAIDEEFMDGVNEFFEKCLARKRAENGRDVA